MLQAFKESANHSLLLVLISSLRDFADLLSREPELCIQKLDTVAIMGGLEPDICAESGWKTDTSVNNGFDSEAAEMVYSFCFKNSVRMTVVSRHAVPLLPMQLAKSFAERTHDPVMRYLADAQFLGLQGLWQKLCEGKLPDRCNKQWYLQTFCGIDQVTVRATAIFNLEIGI
ncbi:hypothetical protein T492DRAFT_197669 [Pavlovales sp. CCMP2436]|nr:hypothetical protein T492DRAFT_197669 [Pavlovales sp. CCMP2436]